VFCQKCHMNMGLTLTGHGAVYLMRCSSSAHVHVQSEDQKNMVYEHPLKRNQEPNLQIFDTAKCVSQYSTVGIVTSYRLHNQGFKSWQGQEIFLFLKLVHIGSGAHPASYSIGIRCSGKRLGYVIDHSPPARARLSG
jgi:hypothetical protein